MVTLNWLFDLFFSHGEFPVVEECGVWSLMLLMRPAWLNFPCHHLVKVLGDFVVGRGDVVSYMLV